MRKTVAFLVAAGIPVCAHIGFTPQSVHALGGFVVQGRGEAAGPLLADAQAVATAGAFAVVLEMVPAELAAQVTSTTARVVDASVIHLWLRLGLVLPVVVLCANGD